MKNILHELYFGRVSRWECRANRTAEEDAIEEKIYAAKQYFKESMSAEDYTRLRGLEDLLVQFRNFEDIRTFGYGFRLGAMVMCAVFCGEETDSHDKF